MIDFDSAMVIYGLLTVFCLLLQLLLYLFARASGKGSVPRFPLFFAGAFFFLWAMEREHLLSPIPHFEPIILLIPAGMLAVIGFGDLMATLLYRLFRLENK